MAKEDTEAGVDGGKDKVEAASGSLLKRIRTSKQRVRKRAPGRPTAMQAEQLRDGVLNAALHAFMKHGFEAASIESIARDAKVAKITIYRQFGDKEQLFREVAHYAQSNVQRNLQAIVDVKGPVEQVLRQLIAQLHDALTQPDYLEVLRMGISQAPRFPEIARSFMDDTDFALGPLINYLQKLRDEGVIHIQSPRDAAIQMTALAMGGVRYLMLKPSTLPEAREHRVESIYQLFAKSWGLMPVTNGKRPRAARGA